MKMPIYELLFFYGKWYYNDRGLHQEARPLLTAERMNVHGKVLMARDHGMACYGFACNIESPGVIVEHAWRVDTEGMVIELSREWSSPSWYFGILVPNDVVAVTCDSNFPSPAGCDFLRAWFWASKRIYYTGGYINSIKRANTPNLEMIGTTLWEEVFSSVELGHYDPMVPYSRFCHSYKYLKGVYTVMWSCKRVRRYYIIWLLKGWNASIMNALVFSEDVIEVILTMLAYEGPSYRHYMRRRSRADRAWAALRKDLIKYKCSESGEEMEWNYSKRRHTYVLKYADTPPDRAVLYGPAF